jgi:hypothetical protein
MSSTRSSRGPGAQGTGRRDRHPFARGRLRKVEGVCAVLESTGSPAGHRVHDPPTVQAARRSSTSNCTSMAVGATSCRPACYRHTGAVIRRSSAAGSLLAASAEAPDPTKVTPAASQASAMSRCSFGAPHPTQAASTPVRSSQEHSSVTSKPLPRLG